MPTNNLLLPARTRLFHIGPPKTGTTALQHTLAALRPELLEHGVRYPGNAISHRMPVASALGRQVGWSKSADGADRRKPDRKLWENLLAEVHSDQERRIFFGHEYAAGANLRQVEQIVGDIGERLHVVATLRSFSLVLPSFWQESNKAAGNIGTFDEWLKNVFDPSTRVSKGVLKVQDHGSLVRRWAKVVGPENMTVVVVDDSDRNYLFTTFEQLLGLPEGMLVDGPHPVHSTNRSLSVPEIELARRLNMLLRDTDLEWEDFNRLVALGGWRRMLGHRRPGPAEPRLTLPDWAADVVDEHSARHVEQIAASGVRVIGDLGRLSTPARRRSGPEEDHRLVETVPIDAAVEALAGVVAAATGHNPDFTQRTVKASRKTGGVSAISSEPAKELLAELARRGRRKLSHSYRRVLRRNQS